VKDALHHLLMICPAGCGVSPRSPAAARPPGREAFLASVFYLHSRVCWSVHRASPKKRFRQLHQFGELTAIDAVLLDPLWPIIETLAGDVSVS